MLLSLLHCPWHPFFRINLHPFFFLPDFWLAEEGLLWRHSPECPFISRLGRCTPHLICGGGNFSTYKSCTRKKIERICATSIAYCCIGREIVRFVVLSLLARLFLVLRYREEGSAFVLNFGRKLAVFVHSFHRLGSFVEPKAWEHKSPKPLERKTLLQKSQQKEPPSRRRQTDR